VKNLLSFVKEMTFFKNLSLRDIQLSILQKDMLDSQEEVKNNGIQTRYNNFKGKKSTI